MRHVWKSGIAGVALTFGAHASIAEEQVILYNWFEHITQELLDEFTDETGIEVVSESKSKRR